MVTGKNFEEKKGRPSYSEDRPQQEKGNKDRGRNYNPRNQGGEKQHSSYDSRPENRGNYSGRSDKPYTNREDKPYQSRGDRPYQNRSDRSYQNKEDRPYQSRGDKPYSNRGERSYQNKSDKPYQGRSKSQGGGGYRGTKPYNSFSKDDSDDEYAPIVHPKKKPAGSKEKNKDTNPDKAGVINRLEKEKKVMKKKTETRKGKNASTKPQVRIKRTNNIDWTREYENDSYDDDDAYYNY